MAEKNTILEDAARAVYGDQETAYGHPSDDLGRTAQMWSAILGQWVRPEQVALCMIAVKLSRLCHSYKRDSIVDVAGWAAVLERVLLGGDEENPSESAPAVERPPLPPRPNIPAKVVSSLCMGCGQMKALEPVSCEGSIGSYTSWLCEECREKTL